MGSDENHFNVSVGSDGQSHKTVSTNHNLFEERGEPKRNRTEVLPLTSPLPLGQTGPHYVHRDHKAYKRRGDQDGHLDFHTAPELWLTNFCSMLFTSTGTVRTIRDGHLHSHTVPELWLTNLYSMLFTFTETVRTIRDGGPRTATSTLTQFLSSEHTPGRNKGLLNRTKSKIAPLTAFLSAKQ